MEYTYLKLYYLKKYCTLFKHSFSNIFMSRLKIVAYILVIMLIALFNHYILPNAIATNILKPYSLIATLLLECIFFIFFTFKIGKVKRYNDFILAFNSLGMNNSIGVTPIPIRYKIEKEKNKVMTYTFFCPSFTVAIWNEYTEQLQSALNVFVVSISETNRKDFIEIKIIEENPVLPRNVEWNFAENMDFEIYDRFIINLGKNQMGYASIDLMKMPHILLAGSSGYGKTKQLQCILEQCTQKNSKVFIVDPKNSSDFDLLDDCTVVTTVEEAINITEHLFAEIEKRKVILKEAKLPNVNEYNRTNNPFMNRIVLAIDETSLLFDTTGMDKNEKEITTKLIRNITNLCRIARAYNIHIILCTQRPSIESIPGTIKANMTARICGYMPDTQSSETILGDGSAAKLPAIAGRFILRAEDGTNIIYQAFNMKI